jgi:hypothetical protein
MDMKQSIRIFAGFFSIMGKSWATVKDMGRGRKSSLMITAPEWGLAPGDDFPHVFLNRW